MAKPLRSEIKNPPNRQFAHFGVLDAGHQSKGALFGAVTLNIVLALIAVIIGASVKKQIDDRKKKDVVYNVIPLKEKPPEPPKPKIPPPPKLPPPPKPIVTPEPPKIVRETPPKLPDIPKPIPVPVPKPVPVMVQAPPKVIVAAAAPKVQAVAMPAQSAALKNASTAPPAPVALGRMNSPVPTNLTGPAVSNIRMNNGMSGMPPGAGVGKPSAVNIVGNGSPSGGVNGTGVAKVEGVKIGGCNGCNGKPGGNATGTAPQQIAIAHPPPPPPPVTRPTVAGPSRKPPEVLYIPKPVYTADATQNHIEGSITVKVRVAANGAVTVLGLANSLGHGLDEAARQCAANIRFKPAVDASGNPVEWDGPVIIRFQMA
jgi:TonB family protein